MKNLHPIMAECLRPFIPLTTAHAQQPEPNNYQTVVLKGDWIEYQYTSPSGVIYDCYLDYQPKEKQTRQEPGVEESATLAHALMNGVDVSEDLSDEIVSMIEIEALGSVAEAKESALYDRGEDRYNFKKAFA